MNAATDRYDLLVVGFGKAGKTIAMKRAKAGDKVALIERSESMYGGTCINVGCVPTKTLLVDSARFALQGSSEAIEAPEAFERAQARRDRLVGKLNPANLSLVEKAGAQVIVGDASFVGPHAVCVRARGGLGSKGFVVKADKIVIDTGSVPVWPQLPGIGSPRVYDSTTIQHIERLPRRLAIVGGGPIGLEFATLFSGYGSKVVVLERSNDALGRFDADVAANAIEVMAERGIEFFTGATVESFSDEESDLMVRLEDGRLLRVDAALVAIGRKPATEGLDLDKAGVELDARGAIKVDEHLRTSAEGIWAAGDVNGGPQFTYVSFDDHRIILQDAWGADDGTRRTTANRIIPTTTFMEPPLATVGMSERQAREGGKDFSIRRGSIESLATLPRPKILGEAKGMAKFLVDNETDEILGATIFCVDAQELINTVALAMQHHITASELGAGIYTHPSSSELFNALLG